MAERWFVIVEFNQASGRPDPDQSFELFTDLDEAIDTAGIMQAANRREGRREHFEVYELVEVDRD